MSFSRFTRHFVATITFLAISGTAAVSQNEDEKMILVLDASGSMWGQIDGVNKIVIAKQAVNDLLDTLPASQSVGLSAYGHREKGSCTDIELLVPAAPNSGDAIRTAVDAISPKTAVIRIFGRRLRSMLLAGAGKSLAIFCTPARSVCSASACRLRPQRSCRIQAITLC